MATAARRRFGLWEGRLRGGGVAVGALALTAAVFELAGRLGFNPTDDGYILAQSYRILHGQIPHQDFISPRPVGSPIIHLLDFVLPLPLLEASRLIVTVELIACALLIGWLVLGRSPGRWRGWEAAAVAASALVSIHAFPLMAWHTIDGLLLVALGFVLVQYPRTAAAGLIALGAAVVVKQSFFLAPVLGAAMLAASLPAARRVGAIVRSLLWAAIPGALYVIVMAALGAGRSFAHQMIHARPTFGQELLRQMLTTGGLARAAIVVVLLTALLAADARAAVSTGVVLRLLLTGFVVETALDQNLQLYGTWADRVEEITAIIVLWHMVRHRRLDWPGIAVVATGWMVSVSWGYVVPNLIAGGLALLAVVRLWDGFHVGTRWASLLTVLAALAVFGGTTAVFVHARLTDIYRDRTASQLTFPLSRIAADFGPVRTNPDTGAYLTDVKRCVGEMPASRVAVLPNNAGLYPILHLHNPLPLDWLWVDELAGSSDRITAAASALNQHGDYLALFETEDASAVPIYGLHPNPTPLVPGIFELLHGRQSRCGSFIAVYSPPSPWPVERAGRPGPALSPAAPPRAVGPPPATG